MAYGLEQSSLGPKKLGKKLDIGAVRWDYVE